MNMTTAFAVAYAAATTGVVAFQLALALGAPWGAYAMGGSVSGSFPPALRVAAVAQGVVLSLMAAVVLSRAGLALPGWSQAAPWLTWAVVAFTGLTLVLNVITPSAGERQIWAPVALMLFASSLAVALTAE